MVDVVKRLQMHMREKKIDYGVFYNFHAQNINENFIYLSRFHGVGVLVVPKSGSAVLVVPRMEQQSAEKVFSKVVAKDDIFGFVSGKLKSGTKIGLDYSSVTLKGSSLLKKKIKGKLSFVDVSDHLSSLREIKSDEEIAIMRKACKITEEIYYETFSHFDEFERESDVAAFMTALANSQGLQLSFKPIVASGVHSSEAHFEVSDCKLKKGFCVIDFGIRYHNYCSDMTRTVFIGKPKKADLLLYEKVLKVQLECLDMVKPGVRCMDIDLHARKILGSDFCHGLGHGVGVGVHEGPSVSPKSKHKLVPGNVITIEPGVYLKGKYGIRIEDDVLVTAKGKELLTKMPKHLLVVEK